MLPCPKTTRRRRIKGPRASLSNLLTSQPILLVLVLVFQGGGIKSGIKSGMAMADAAFIARGSEWGDGGLVKHLHGLPAPALGAVSYGGS